MLKPDAADILKRYPPAIYPYFLACNIIKGAAAMTDIAWQCLRRGKKPLNPVMATKPDRNAFKSLMQGRPPENQVALGTALSLVAEYWLSTYRRIARDPDKLVWHEDMIPPEIILAMGLIPLMLESPSLFISMLSSTDALRYIDVAENAGYPGDICSVPKATLGMILQDFFPPPAAIVTSNSPCDGGMAYYLPIEQKTKAPVFRLDIPYDVRAPQSREYIVKEIRRMIAFLEETTGARLEIDRLREVCELRNRMFEAHVDFWELMKQKPCPMSGDVLYLGAGSFITCAGTRLGVRTLNRILREANAAFAKGQGSIPAEKHRAVVWNPLPFLFPDFYRWLEQEHQTVVVMDMLTYSRNPFINTTSEESMLDDLAEIFANGPMARHTRGPAAYYFEDLFRVYSEYQADMIIFFAHQSCKNTRALMGMLRDYCRRKGIPLLIVDYELLDSRVVSIDGVKKQIADFMDNVMINY
jgi:benzoyl-CoA reductase/2-hydroxyglutaryl-CoA dehydratase subunit BcrC/BadD/HgdB